MVLDALDLLQAPTRDKTTEYMRYGQRLKSFWSLSSPEVLPYEQFKEMVTIPRITSIVLSV
jgi:hypothetical protein